MPTCKLAIPAVIRRKSLFLKLTISIHKKKETSSNGFASCLLSPFGGSSMRVYLFIALSVTSPSYFLSTMTRSRGWME